MRTLESTQDPEPMALGSHQSQRKRTQLFGLLRLQTVYELVQVTVIVRGGHLIRVRPRPRSWNSAERDSWQETVDRPGRRPWAETLAGLFVAAYLGLTVHGRGPRIQADVAVVGSNYATSHKLKAGSTITIGKTTFTVVGIVTQPQSGSPTDVYIPLPRAQALATAGGTNLKNKVNTIYVTAPARPTFRPCRRRSGSCCPATRSPPPPAWPARYPGR